MKILHDLKSTLEATPIEAPTLLDRLAFALVQLPIPWTSCERGVGENCISIDSATFLEYALPFSVSSRHPPTAATIQSINSQMVLRSTYRRYDPPADVQSVLNGLNHQSLTGGPQQARYRTFGSTGIYAPIEGKNRTALFQQYGQPITALVTQYPYPSKSDLHLVRLLPGNVWGLQIIGPVQAIHREHAARCRVRSYLNHRDGLIGVLPYKECAEALRQFGVTQRDRTITAPCAWAACRRIRYDLARSVYRG